MAQKKTSRPTPPPLPDVASDDGADVQPPPLLDESDLATETDPDSKELDASGQFLKRAGAVMAHDRGINARSRVKLAAIADELGLSEDEFTTAMEQLLGGAKTETKLSRDELRELRQRKKAFHNLIGETLTALPQGVLTASMETMLVTAGVEEHNLAREDALADVLQLTKQLGIRRITLDEAQRHIGELTDYAVKPNGVLRDDVRQRIYAEGSRWGLTPDQVDPILRERLSHVRLGERKSHMRIVALISISAAVLVGVMGMIAWMAITRSLPEVPSDDPIAVGEGEEIVPSVDGEAASGVPTPKPAKFGVPAWWNEDLASYIANVRLRIPVLESDLYQLRSPKSEARADAYMNLLHAVQHTDRSENERAILSALFAAAYAAEPADDCADQLRDGWMQIATAPGKSLPKQFSEYETSIWVAETAITTLLQPDLSDARRTALLDALDRTLETTLHRDLPPLKLQRQIMGATGAYLYKSLTRHALSNVDIAVDLHKELTRRVEPYLDTATSDHLATNYLRQVLPALGERWPIYEDLIRRCTVSEDPLNVLLMVEVFETTKVAALQSYLAAQLVVRTGLSTTRRSVGELAAAVREELGVTGVARPVDSAERYALWREAAETALAREPRAVDDTTAFLEEVMATTRLSALGAALAQGDLGAAEYAALWEEKPVELKERRASRSGSTTGTSRVNTSTLRNLDRNIDALRNFRRLDKGVRVRYFQLISTYAGSISDVQAQQGQDIAAYLTAPKAVDEHEHIMTMADSVVSWPMVRLGIADQIADSRLRTEHLGELVEKTLHRDVDTETDTWRAEMRGELLAAVASELTTEAALDGEDAGPADRAAEAIADYYRTQAKMAGVAASAYGEAKLPSDVLLLLIQQTAAKLSASRLAPADRQRVDNLPHELIAVDFVTGNDLARTVKFQRIWFDLLAIETGQANGKKAAALSELQSDLQRQDAAVEHILTQLADGERALLRLWLIHNEP